MSDDIEKKPKQQKKGYQKRLLIEGAHTQELAGNYSKLAKHLDMPVRLLEGWRRRDNWGPSVGWLSFPITPLEYQTLLVIRNYLWGHEGVLRMQLSRMSLPRRERVLRGTDLSWIERVTLEDVLRRKCRGERDYIRWKWYRCYMESRFPLGYQQLTAKILERMKKKACEIIRHAKKNGYYNQLLLSLELQGVEEIAPSPELSSLAAPVRVTPTHAHAEQEADFSAGFGDAGSKLSPEEQERINYEWASQYQFNDILNRALISEKIRRGEAPQYRDVVNEDDEKPDT